MTDQTEYLQGQPIGKYEIERELGRGGMGAVLLARDTVLDRKVALKVIKRTLLTGDATTSQKDKIEARFIREAKVSAMINHTNIATVYDATLDGDVWFIAMEYINGESLAEVLKTEKPFNPLKTARLLHWIADGLRHAWEKHSIIHRDVKPANVMIDTDGTVKLIDLGIAKPMVEDENTHTLTMENEMVATPRYSAPEQMLGKELTEKVDVFALGVLAYETLTGRPAFRGASVADLYAKKAVREYAPLTDLRDDVPEELAALVDGMLAPQPEDRPGYERILEVLGAICNTGTGTRVLDAPAPVPARAHMSRSVMWVGLAACLAVVAGVVAFAMKPKDPPPSNPGKPEGGKPGGFVSNDERVGKDFIYGYRLKMDMVWVPELKGWASRYETTIGQLRSCSSFRSKTVGTVGGVDFERSDMPAVMVTRGNAETYCKWLNPLQKVPEGYEFRLPTLEEWQTIRPTKPAKRSMQPMPTKTLSPDSRELYGVIGNVWELTNDGFACGGCWLSEPWEYSADRPKSKMTYADARAHHNVGFRLFLMPKK